jgi:hypothetical protein
MIGNSETRQAAPASVTACRLWVFTELDRKASEPTFFAHGAEGGEVRDRAPVVFWLGFWFWWEHPGAELGRFFRLPGRGRHLGGPATKWGGRGPAGHAAVPPAVRC